MNRHHRPNAEPLEARALLAGIPGLVETLTTDRATYALNQPVSLFYTETNTTERPITITTTASDIDFTVRSGGTAIFEAQKGEALPFNVGLITLAPGSSRTIRRVWGGLPNEGQAGTPTGSLTVSQDGASATIAIIPVDYAPIVRTFPPDGGFNFVGPVYLYPPEDSGSIPIDDPAYRGKTAAVDLYGSILGRTADLAGFDAAAAEIQTGASTAPGVPIAYVATGLVHSAEHDADVAASDYQGYLGRPGSAREIAAWVAAMRSGLTEQQVAADFLASPESSGLHKSDADYAGSLYRVVLDREATPAELSAAEGQLRSGTITRAGLASDLVTSAEADEIAIQGFHDSAGGRPSTSPDDASLIARLQAGSMTLDDVLVVVESSTLSSSYPFNT